MYPLADIVIVAIMLSSVLIGLYRGFTRELFTLLIWLLPTALVLMYWQTAATWLSTSPYTAEYASFINWQNETLTRWISIASIFIPTFLLLDILRFIMKRASNHSIGDRVMGLIFGALRGGLIVMLTLVAGQKLAWSQQTWWSESNLIPPTLTFTQKALAKLPSNIQQKVNIVEKQTATQ